MFSRADASSNNSVVRFTSNAGYSKTGHQATAFKSSAGDTAHTCSHHAAPKAASGVGQQLSALQSTVSKALSSINMALDIASARYAKTGSNGFNTNNITAQISQITKAVEGLIEDVKAASQDKNGCPASGQLQGLNDDLSKANGNVPNNYTAMTPELHAVLTQIQTLLTQLQAMMQGRGNYHSQ